jgi:hypothetical protein
MHSREYWLEDSDSKDVTSRVSIQKRRGATDDESDQDVRGCMRRDHERDQHDGFRAAMEGLHALSFVIRDKARRTNPLIVRAVRGRAPTASASQFLLSSLHAACPNAGA